MYDFQAEDLVKAIREIAPLMDDMVRLEDHMINGCCLFEGTERLEDDDVTDEKYIEHALVARAWQLYCIRTGQ
jgi:hypothetical protein